MQIVVRAAVMYFFVWFLTRAMGKKEMAQLSVFEMILAVTMGDLIQQGVTQEDQSLTGAMLAVGTIGMLVVLFSFVAYKTPRTRSAIEGIPVILVRDGKPVQRAMQYERISLDEVKDAARAQGIETLAQVKLAILEPGGTFSFLKADGQDDQQGEPAKKE
ncbi:MAG: DUF421 domain-containing protein [Actinomycetota bacterium]|nr:DUF421 domain-containing protein [Actinomycetota bacterium]